MENTSSSVWEGAYGVFMVYGDDVVRLVGAFFTLKQAEAFRDNGKLIYPKAIYLIMRYV